MMVEMMNHLGESSNQIIAVDKKTAGVTGKEKWVGMEEERERTEGKKRKCQKIVEE